MPATRCPHCGKTCPDAEIEAGSTYLCGGCGRAISGNLPAPPQSARSASDRWSEGPPEASANRWSAEAPLGDDSSSSESVSQTSILPSSDFVKPVVVPPRRSPPLWTLIVVALFLVVLIGLVVLARSIWPGGVKG
jgi:hypothetical protein